MNHDCDQAIQKKSFSEDHGHQQGIEPWGRGGGGGGVGDNIGLASYEGGAHQGSS